MVWHEVLLNFCFNVSLIVYSWHVFENMAQSIAKSIAESKVQIMAESMTKSILLSLVKGKVQSKMIKNSIFSLLQKCNL